VYFRFTRRGALAGLWLIAFAATVEAQVIISPAANQVFPAAPDFATDVLHDAWDFNNAQDLSPHPHDALGWVESPAANAQGPAAFLRGGWFEATSNSNDPGLGLLYRGWQGVVNAGRSGLKSPISSSTYYIASFRMRSANAANRPPVISYFDRPIPAAPTGQIVVPGPYGNGERVYQVNLLQTPPLDGGARYDAHPAYVGLRLDPTDVSGPRIGLDWFRLSAPAWMRVQVNGCSSFTASVQEPDGLRTPVEISGGQFNYGIFPPSPQPYALVISCQGQTVIQPFFINTPPSVVVLNPDETGGEDFATAVRGNAWDWDSAADVAHLTNIANATITTLNNVPVLQAVNTGSTPATRGDPQIWLLNEDDGQPTIATARYRYLTFSLALGAEFDLRTPEGGSVLRVLWGTRENFEATKSVVTKDMPVWPGFNTYTIDLGSLTAANGGLESGGVLTEPWMTNAVKYFRLDPHEFGLRNVPFALGPVKLAAPDEVQAGGAFDILWNVADPDVSSMLTTIYYVPESGGSWTPLASNVPTSAGINSYRWNVPGSVAPGNYRILVRVSEARSGMGVQLADAVSTGILRVQAPGAGLQPPAPPVLHPASVNGLNISLSWTPGGGGAATSYTLHAGGSSGSSVHRFWLGQATSINTAAGPGVFYVRIQASNAAGSAFSNEIAFGTGGSAPRTPPGAPILSPASVRGNVVSLAWQPGPGPAPTGYTIVAGSRPGGSDFGVFPMGLATGITAAVGDGLYYVRVIAHNGAASTSSPEISVIVGATSPPGPPVMLPATVGANRVVTLQWSPPTTGGAPTSYTILARYPGHPQIIAALPGQRNTVFQVAAPPGTYIVTAVAINGRGQSAESNAITVQVP
jgi:hypothetical protein